MLDHIWDSWGNPEMNLTLLTFPLPEAFSASHRGSVNNVNNVKFQGVLSPKSPFGFNIITLLTLLTYPVKESFYLQKKDSALLTLLTFPLPEAPSPPPTGEMLTMPKIAKGLYIPRVPI